MGNINVLHVCLCKNTCFICAAWSHRYNNEMHTRRSLTHTHTAVSLLNRARSQHVHIPRFAASGRRRRWRRRTHASREPGSAAETRIETACAPVCGRHGLWKRQNVDKQRRMQNTRARYKQRTQHRRTQTVTRTVPYIRYLCRATLSLVAAVAFGCRNTNAEIDTKKRGILSKTRPCYRIWF